MTSRRTMLIISAGAILFSGIFLYASATYYRIGFPLDDAWIHQTFARNLVQRGEWSINLGEPTSGSTAPLWTFILAIGYYLHIPHLVWAFGLGMIFLECMGMVGITWLASDSGLLQRKYILCGLIMISEWHLIWAAVSGMEILLFCLFILIVFYELTRMNTNWILVGLLAGASIWVRPDGLTLLGPILVVAGIQSYQRKVKIQDWARLLVPLTAMIGGYLWMNYNLSGSIWPNTFAAKQTEYAVLQQTSMINRYLGAFITPLIGVGFVLLPGFVVWIVQAIKQHKWVQISILAWILGFIYLYAWKLPVTYQHGRYLIPIIPVYLIVSMQGLLSLKIPDYSVRWKYIFSRVYLALLILVPLAFFILGIQAYQKDVAIIESEMVETAKWISTHTNEDNLIAAHDIGALGVLWK